jgi:hypothetical protein
MDKALADAPDGQISLTDPDARAMATRARHSGHVGYNVQSVVDAETHLIVTHEVTNQGMTGICWPDGHTGQGSLAARGHAHPCRQGLFQRPRDPCLPQGRHHRDRAPIGHIRQPVKGIS